MTGTSPHREVSATRVAAVAEDLYRLLPAHVRQSDLMTGSALRALFGVLALSSAEIDAELDAYYDALFVETSDRASLAYLAALVGSIPLQPLPPGASFDERAYVANTVRYRRGKGTIRVIEELASDVTGYGATGVEYFLRVSRLQHLLDVRPERPATGHVVDGDTSARSGSGFDRLPRLLDVRDIGARRGHPTGRHNISSVGVHLLRPTAPAFPAPPGSTLPAATMAGVPQARPWPVGGGAVAGFFQLAAQPSAPLRLFGPDRRADAGGTRPQARDLADRLRRLPLHRETEELRAAEVEGRAPRLPDRPWFDTQGRPFQVFLRRVGETTYTAVPPAQLRIANLEQPPAARPPATLAHAWYRPGTVAPDPQTGAAALSCAVDPATGRIVAALPPAGAPDVEEVRVAYGTAHGRAIGAGAQDRGDAEQPFEIRDDGPVTDLVWVVDPTVLASGSAETGSRTVPSLAQAMAEVAAQGAGRRSFVVLVRCDVEGPPSGSPTLDVPVHPESEVHLVAAEWRAPVAAPGVPTDPDLRGFLVRRERRFTIDAPVRVQRGTAAPGRDAGRLVLDGVELTQGLRLGVRSVGRFALRHSTVRSPGSAALTATGELTAVDITIDRSICGPVRVGSAAARVTGTLTVLDGIVGVDGASGDALAAPDLDVCLRNVTILGSTTVRAIEATNTLFNEPVSATRRQTGCVRYSFVPEGSSTPRTFRCQPQLALRAAREANGGPIGITEATRVRLSVEPVLMDDTLDEPTVGLLHVLCPTAITLGGEDQAEIGAFAAVGHGIAVANLVSLFDDMVPSALRAGVVDDTRSAAVAQRRNRP